MLILKLSSPSYDCNNVYKADSDQREMPLGGIRSHGAYRSHLLFKKTYRSIQASLNPVVSSYRTAGQVTGLLFRSSCNEAHSDLLGQLTGSGPSYDLDEAEQILDLEFTTMKPRRPVLARHSLSQVASITVVTNLRRICWGLNARKGCVPKLADLAGSEHRIIEACWDFNAMFDRLRCTYS